MGQINSSGKEKGEWLEVSATGSQEEFAGREEKLERILHKRRQRKGEKRNLAS